ncbi:uncharacterized protein LOC133206177 isoform X2 [Saccostrea echinata]|uniref:uncharacterized protein LOC133206177 isoform X2 n=1 Tax=Saccostrea echinata TaxID=191078 RepID=UPI002A837F03|nr:uncharacterized protein LOC133206177 isoform X2 [Saccostrea echinata]
MDSKDSLFSKSSSILEDTSWMYRVDMQPESRETYCTCAQNGPVDTYQFSLPNAVHCNMTSPSQLCEGGNSVNTLNLCSNSDDRKRRSTDDTDNVDIESELIYDTDYNESAVIEVAQWMNGWDETSATEFCSKQFDLDSAVDVCNRLVNISKILFLDECVADIKISGNTTFIQDTLKTLKGSCLTEATRNEVFYVNQSSDASGLTLFDYISSFLCPGNCSGNGLCVNATCSCFDGFLGTDCSGKLSVPPKDFLLPLNGLCDISSRECLKTNIMGFFDVENVTAKFEYFKISAEIPKPPGSLRRRRAATAKSMVHGWNISLSYDGKTYSSHVTMLIFNGQVYKCDVQTLACNSLNQISTDSSTDTETHIHILIVGIIVGFLVVVIVTTIVVLKKFKGNSVVSTINISRDRKVPVRQEKFMPSVKILNDRHGTVNVTLFKEKTEICGSVDVFFTPSPPPEYSIPPLGHRFTPSFSPEVSIPPLGHRMESNEFNSLSIESYD